MNENNLKTTSVIAQPSCDDFCLSEHPNSVDKTLSSSSCLDASASKKGARGQARTLALLGASGSIGQQASELLANRSDVRIKVLSGGSNAKALQRAIDLLRPEIVLANSLILGSIKAPKVLPNSELANVLESYQLDGVINATSGFAGLNASLIATQLKLPLYLANKESLVIAAHLLKSAQIYPIDSEHSALASLLKGAAHIDELIITASGGAFKDTPLAELKNVSAKQALRHPNWQMGAKITIDSATMMNKIYELLEAKALFNPAKLDAFIERTSIVHALIRCKDESVRMYASCPDMKLAISSAIFSEADFAACKRLDLAQMASLRFEPISSERYGMWSLKDELLARPELGVILNAADEVAVGAFLDNKCGYLDIFKLVASALEHFGKSAVLESSYEALVQSDEAVRAWVSERIN